MASIEAPRRRRDGTYWTRVSERVGGRGSAVVHMLVEGQTEESCLARAGAVKVDLEDKKRAGQLQAAAPTRRRGQVTWDDLLVAWMSGHVAVRDKGETLKQYPGLCERYISALLGPKVVDETTPEDGITWREQVRKIAGRNVAADGAGKPMANRMVRIAKGMLNWGVRHELIARNPWLNVEQFAYAPPVEQDDYAPTPEHIELLRAIFLLGDFCFGPHDDLARLRNALIVSLLGFEALRQQDLEGTWRRLVDAHGNVLPWLGIDKGKTRAAHRRPDLWQQVQAEAQAYYDALLRPAPTTSFLAGARGGGFSRHNFRRDAWDEAVMIATAVDLESIPGAPHDVNNLPGFIRPHFLRRGGASMMGYAGIPRAAAAAHLGHESWEQTTLRFYERPYPGGRWREGMTMEEQIAAAQTFVWSADVHAAIGEAMRTTLPQRLCRACEISDRRRKASRRSPERRCRTRDSDHTA